MTPLRGIVRRAIFGSEERAFDGEIEVTHVQTDGREISRGAQFGAEGLKIKEMTSDSMAIWKPDGAKNIPPSRAMQANVGWVSAATRVIADEIANTQWRLYQIKGEDHEEVFEHEVLDLLEGVNEYQTGPEFKHQIASHLELCGNAYVLMVGVKSWEDKPEALYLLPPGHVRVVVNRDSFPYKLEAYEMTLDGKVYTYQPYEILHIKYPDPNDQFTGIGVPQMIASWVDVANYADEFNRKFFKQGAKLDYAISMDTTNEAQAKRFTTKLKNKTEGVENAHKIPVLPKGVKIEQIGSTQKDMDFVQLDVRYEDKILAAHRVSKTILGTAESDTNRATAETADYVFAKRTIKPKMLLICSFINEFLVPRYADDIYITFLDPVPEDKAFRTTEMQAAVGSQPVLTANEARKNYMGLGEIEGGDKLMRPSAMTPADGSETDPGDEGKPTDGEGTSDEGTTTTTSEPGKDDAKRYTGPMVKTASGNMTRAYTVRAAGKDGKFRSQFSRSRKLRAVARDGLSKRLDELFAKRENRLKEISKMTDEDYLPEAHKFIERGEKAEKKLIEAFKKINAEQKAEVLARLKKETKAFDPFNLDSWITITVDAATPILTDLGKSEAAAAAEFIGQDTPDIYGDAGTKAALDSSIELMAKSYNETARTAIQQAVGEGISQGASYADIAQKVSDVYDFQDSVSALRIARTETVRVSNMANKAAWQQSGVVKTVIWYTFDDTACEYCQEQKGKEIDVDANFFDQGDTITGSAGGELTADYSDIGGPPLHPNCRCYLRPGQVSLD